MDPIKVLMDEMTKIRHKLDEPGANLDESLREVTAFKKKIEGVKKGIDQIMAGIEEMESDINFEKHYHRPTASRVATRFLQDTK